MESVSGAEGEDYTSSITHGGEPLRLTLSGAVAKKKRRNARGGQRKSVIFEWSLTQARRHSAFLSKCTAALNAHQNRSLCVARDSSRLHVEPWVHARNGGVLGVSVYAR